MADGPIQIDYYPAVLKKDVMLNHIFLLFNKLFHTFMGLKRGGFQSIFDSSKNNRYERNILPLGFYTDDQHPGDFCMFISWKEKPNYFPGRQPGERLYTTGSIE